MLDLVINIFLVGNGKVLKVFEYIGDFIRVVLRKIFLSVCIM